MLIFFFFLAITDKNQTPFLEVKYLQLVLLKVRPADQGRQQQLGTD